MAPNKDVPPKPVVLVAGVVDVDVDPKTDVAPNGRMVDVFVNPLPNENGWAVFEAGAAAVAVGAPKVNVEFKDVADVALGAGVGVEPKRNPDVAGVGAVDVAVVPKARFTLMS